MSMAVRVAEVGTRPAVLTIARRNAPQATRVLGELLGQRVFGDLAVVVLDWSNELGQQPDEVAKPCLHFSVSKEYRDRGKILTVESRINVDDVFGEPDLVTRKLLEDLIQELAEKIASEEAQMR